MVKLIIQLVGIGFVVGGCIHWMIILGIMQEATPVFITFYFHSLAVLSPLAGIGLFKLRKWGRGLGFFIVITQIPAHLYMIWLDNFTSWESGLSLIERGFDIGFAVFYIIFFSRPNVKKLFEKQH